MEYDLNLRSFLINDNNILRLETKFMLDFLKCKLDKCYTNNNNKTKYTHEDFENCKETCYEKLNKLNLIRETIYKDFTEFYYNKFFECSKIIDENEFQICNDTNKKLMVKNIEEIKRLILTYNY